MAIVMVERKFDQEQSIERFQAMENAVQWCLDMHSVKALHSYVSTDLKRMICVYEAPDAEAVRHVNEQSGVPFERVWTARRVSADDTG